MKPLILVLRLFGLTLLLVGIASAYDASCVTDGNASKNVAAAFEKEEDSIKEAEAQANVDYANDKLRCKGQQTTERPNATGCMVDAQRKFQRAQNDIGIRRNDNNATRSKALIDIQAAADECNVTGSTPAEKEENLRHFHAEVAAKKTVVDVNNNYADGKLACASKFAHDTYESSGSTEESRRTCLKELEKTYASDQIQIEIDRNTENALHAKNQRAILKNGQ